MSELANARRELTKCQQALTDCAAYFDYQAHMNAQAHLSGNVVHPPIHGEIMSAYRGVQMFFAAYPIPDTEKTP